MDTTKWKSVLVPIGVYWKIRELARLENRKIGGQLERIYDEWVEDRRREAAVLDQGENRAAGEVNSDEDGSRSASSQG